MFDMSVRSFGIPPSVCQGNFFKVLTYLVAVNACVLFESGEQKCIESEYITSRTEEYFTVLLKQLQMTVNRLIERNKHRYLFCPWLRGCAALYCVPPVFALHNVPQH